MITLSPASGVRHPSGVRPFTFSNDISSETTGLFPSKPCLKHQCTGGTNTRVIPLVSLSTRYQILKKSSSPRPVVGFQIFFHRNVRPWTVFQIPSKNFISLINMAARGRGHFSIYGHFVYCAYFQHISVMFTITRATF